MLEQACSHEPDLEFHAHSAMDAQLATVAARKEQRVMQALPLAWHMYLDSQVDTLMESVMLTAIAPHASVQTTLTLSHMHVESPEHEAWVVYEREQCWAQTPLAVMKQLASLVHVLASLMLVQICEHICNLVFHTHVASPLQSVDVTRVEQTTAQLPVAVRLQSGRAVQPVPTKGHWVEQAPVLSSHSQTLEATQLLFVAVDAQFSRQMPEMASHEHRLAELSQAALLA